MNRILVIGKYGQVAQEYGKLVSKDEFILCDRSQLDIRSIENIQKCITYYKPSHIINTSAFHIISECENNPLEAFLINTVAIRNLAKICEINNIRLITYSTDYVFDGEKNVPYYESDTVNPLQVYGISKAAGEFAALNYHPQGTIIIRTNAVFGGLKGSIEKKGNFVLSILNEAKLNKTVMIASRDIISPTYSKDLVEASYKLILKDALPGIYHIVNNGHCSWIQFAKKIIEFAGLTNDVEQSKTTIKSNLNRPHFSALSNSKINTLGIPMRPWENAVYEYIQEDLRCN